MSETEKDWNLIALAQVVSSLCYGEPATRPDFELVKPALPFLALLIFSPHEEVLTEACLGLSFLSDGADELKIQEIIEAGVSHRLVELMLNSSAEVREPALQAMLPL